MKAVLRTNALNSDKEHLPARVADFLVAKENSEGWLHCKLVPVIIITAPFCYSGLSSLLWVALGGIRPLRLQQQ